MIIRTGNRLALSDYYLHKIIIYIFSISLICCNNIYSQTLSAENIYKKVSDAVVVILTYDDNDELLMQGSGVVINDKGYVVTNYHVLKDCERIEILHNNEIVPYVDIIGLDEDRDIVILKIEDKKFPAVTVGDSQNLNIGQRVYAIGSPLGFENTLSEGIISGLRSYEEYGTNFIQISASISTGSSGGAVVNDKGELIGISTLTLTEGQNLNFAIPIDAVLDIKISSYSINDINEKFGVSEAKPIEKSDNSETIRYYSESDTKIIYNLDEADSLINEGKYQDAADYLEKFILKDPENQEAHYFLGQAYDKLSMPEETGGNNVILSFALKSTEHFKKVIEIFPYYKGKIFLLDPYSKITSVWGSTASTYACRGDLDSAKWAFNFGREQGGFYPEILEYNKNVMLSCSPNAILFTNGDNDTYPVWYLQLVENYRKDITIINLSLLNTEWYIKQLKYNDPFGDGVIRIKYSDSQIEQLEPIQWEATKISIPILDSTHSQENLSDIYERYNLTNYTTLREGNISWTMDPTLDYEKNLRAIRIQDLMVKEIIESNNWERPIYFAVTCSEDGKIGLNEYLRMEGLAYQLIPQKKGQDEEFINKNILRNNLDIFTSNWLYKDNYKYLDDFQRLTQNYRNAYLRLVLSYLSDAQNDLAIKTLNEMENKIPIAKVPMDFGLQYEICNLYFKANGKEEYNKLSRDVEIMALEKLAEDPSDVTSYYNPYRILLDIYEGQGRNDKLLEIWQKLEILFPEDSNVKSNVEKYKKLLMNK